VNVTTISVTYERKFNLGDFNSAHIGVTVWADVEEGESPAVVADVLFAQAKDAVKEQALPLAKKANATLTAFISGLPADVQATIPPIKN
jgi:hypothetical protein